MYSPSQTRDSHGRWGSGAVAYVKSQLTADNAKLVVAEVIKSTLYHFGGADDAQMEILAPAIHEAVHHGAEHLRVATSQVRAASRAAVVALMLAAQS